MSSGGLQTNAMQPPKYSPGSRMLKLIALLLSGSIPVWLIKKWSQRKKPKEGYIQVSLSNIYIQNGFIGLLHCYRNEFAGYTQQLKIGMI